MSRFVRFAVAVALLVAIIVLNYYLGLYIQPFDMARPFGAVRFCLILTWCMVSGYAVGALASRVACGRASR